MTTTTGSTSVPDNRPNDIKSEDRGSSLKRRAGLWRWAFRLGIALLILLILAVAVIQIVLWTDLPRRWALSAVQRELGLEITAKSLSVGWFGKTSLEDVTVSLPLADEAFFDMPALKVSHTSLPMLLLTQSVEVQAIEMRKPTLIVRQDESGRWNLQEVAQLLARVGGGQSAAQTPTPKKAAAKLPRLLLEEGTVQIIDQGGRQTTIFPLHVAGQPDGPLAWKYDIDAPPQLDIEGQLVPGGAWKHQVALTIGQLGPWMQPWVKNWPQPARLAGKWDGKVSKGQLDGRLELTELRVKDYAASGVIDIQAGGKQTIIRPGSILVKTQHKILPEVHLSSGQITIEDTIVHGQGVQIAAVGGQAQITNATYDWISRAGDLAAVWQEVALSDSIRHGGSLTISLTTPWPGHPQIKSDLSSQGIYAGKSWDAYITMTGQGESWRQMDWKVTAPQLVWDGNQIARDLDAHLRIRDSTIWLDELSAESKGQLSAHGQADVAAQKWWLWAQAENWPMPGTPQATVGLFVNVWADRNFIRMDQFYLQSGAAELTAEGYYGFDWPTPVSLKIHVAHPPIGMEPLEQESDLPFDGKLSGNLYLAGTLWPRELTVVGDLTGRDLFIADRSVGNVKVKLDGRVDGKEIFLETTRLKLFEGQWQLAARYPVIDQQSRDEVMRLKINVEDLPAGEIGDVLKQNNVSGQVDGEWSFDFHSFRIDDISMTGAMTAEDIKTTQFAAEQIQTKMTLRNGFLSIEPIELSQAGGRAQGRISLNVHHPQYLRLHLTASAWPVELEKYSTSLNLFGETSLDIDLQHQSAIGPVKLSSINVTLKDQPVGTASLVAQLSENIENDTHQRIVELKSFEAEVLDGTFSGEGTLNLDNIRQMTGELRWNDLDFSRISTLWPHPRIVGLGGIFAGSARVAPSTDPRALEPVRLEIHVKPTGGHYRELQIKDADIYAYLNKNRIVLSSNQDEQSILNIADGKVYPWARSSKQPGAPYFSQVILEFERLDLNQLVQAGHPKAEPMPGRVSGSFTLVGNPQALDRVFGEGNVELTESDLANFDPFQDLYNALSMVLGAARDEEARGYGSIEFRVEQSTAQIIRMSYFNRGVDARATGTISQIWDMPDSPLDAVVVGTLRPLKDLKIPFLADADEIFSVLQGSLTPIGVRGTLRDPQTYAVTFNEIGRTMQRLLLGETRGSGE